MPMIRMHLNSLIDQRINRPPKRSIKVSTGNHMPKVTIHGIDEKPFAMLVPVVPPGICRAMHNNLKKIPLGMVAPDPSPQRNPILIHRPRHTYIARTRSPTPSIKPPVRPPPQSICKVMIVTLCHCKPIKNHLWFTIRDIIAITVWNKKKLWWAHCPNPTRLNFDTGKHL